MSALFGSQEWAAAVRARIQGDEAYRDAAKGWGMEFNGNILFSIEAGGRLDQPTHLLLELRDGDCLGARLLADPAAADVGFRLRGPWPAWKQVLNGELKPILAISLRKIRLEGSLPTLMKYVPAAQALLRCFSDVEAELPS
ncbi:MAG TPA: SCP2 sterol-binding domain-containing protein [Acidobacteriota bacterium]